MSFYRCRHFRVIQVWRVWAVVVCSLGIVTDARAQVPCPSQGFFSVGEVATAKRRQDFAAFLAGSMRRLHDAIPVLSPAEDKWLQGELQTTGPRQFQAVYSAEGQKSVAKRFTTAQMIDLSALASGTMRPAVEMLLWATVASRYGDSDFANAVADLANRKIIEGGFLPKVPGQEAEVLNGLCNFVEARIMEDILIPYLTDAARKP